MQASRWECILEKKTIIKISLVSNIGKELCIFSGMVTNLQIFLIIPGHREMEWANQNSPRWRRWHGSDVTTNHAESRGSRGVYGSLPGDGNVHHCLSEERHNLSLRHIRSVKHKKISDDYKLRVIEIDYSPLIGL